MLCAFSFIVDKMIGKAFEITDYGVCFIEDMLNEIPESTVLVCMFIVTVPPNIKLLCPFLGIHIQA